MSQVPEDYNKGGMYTFLGAMTFVVLFFVYLLVLHPSIDLNEQIRESGIPTAPAFEGGTDEGERE